MTIESIRGGPPAIERAEPAERSAPAGGQEATADGFAKDLEAAISGVREALAGADRESSSGLVGGGGPHEAMLALSKADLSFRMLAQVRNKAVDAYREIMRLTM